MCLINVVHEHFITQTGKKSKPAFIDFKRPGAEEPRSRGPAHEAEGLGPRKTNTCNYRIIVTNLVVFFISLEIENLVHYVNLKRKYVLSKVN